MSYGKFLQDKEIVKSLDNLVSYLEEREQTVIALEQEVRNLEGIIEVRDIEIDRMFTDISELKDYIKDLEMSLAEVSLMSDDGLTLPRQ